MNNRMNIMLSCDNNLAKYIPSLLESLHDNLVNVELYVYIMHNRIQPDIMETIIGCFEGRIHITEIKPNVDEFELFKDVDRNHLGLYTIEAYYHFYAYKYLPEDIDRVVYLDIDTICVGDFFEWYSTDFENHFYITTTKYEKEDFYAFNAGCFVMNLDLMRQELDNSFFERGIKEKLAMNLSLMGDQEFIGFLFRNYIDNGFLYIQDSGINFRIMWNLGVAEENKQQPDYKIIHYNGRYAHAWEYYFDESFQHLYIGSQFEGSISYNISFLSKNIIDLYNYFWKYCARTPFYDELRIIADAKTQTIKRMASLRNKENKRNYMLKALINESSPALKSGVVAVTNLNCFMVGVGEGDDFLYEFKVKYYIKDQWIIIPLKRALTENSLCRVRLDCNFQTEGAIYLFLANRNLITQSFPYIKSEQYDEALKIGLNGARFLCLSSDSFKRKGDFIRINKIEVEEIHPIHDSLI